MQNVFSLVVSFVIFTVPLVTGCVADNTQSGEDPVKSDQDNDAEQDEEDRDDCQDDALNRYSSYRSVFHKEVESINLDIERNFKLEGVDQKCIRERVALIWPLDFSSQLEVGRRNCGGFLTAAAVKSANGGAPCKEAKIDVESIRLPALSVRRVLGIRSDCVCYYGQRVETIALLVEKLRFAQPTVCARHFDEYQRVIGKF